jgi:Uncharacterised protein family (UPF0236)
MVAGSRPALPPRTSVVVTEMDSTYIKVQQRGRAAHLPVDHFPMHLGLQYTGRKRRYQKRGSTAVSLQNKRWIASARSLSLFGRRVAWQRVRHYGKASQEVILSDGDEGLERLREAEFAHATCLLDRWHIARGVRDFTGGDHPEYERIMRAVWRSDSEAVLEVLRASALRESRHEQFHTLFGYLLGNRDGIDNWHQIPRHLRRSARPSDRSRALGQQRDREEHRSADRPPLQAPGPQLGPGAAPNTSSRSAGCKAIRVTRTHWWQKTALAKTKVNPGWPSSPRPPN